MLLAAILLPLAGYAQYRLPRHTARRSNVLATRALLVAVGIAFGYVIAATYGTDYASRLLAFLAGFGAVHLPAAVILFVKRARGEGRS
ncbi:MAG TPA: hypothetical protein VHG88_04970 [Burkholderiales bacterium]|nr:hypothetical protein [Burkholderiales bacterium]